MRPVLSPAESLGLSGATLEGRVRRAAHHVADPTFARIAEKTGPAEFVGYDRYTDVPSVVKAIVIQGEEQDVLHHGAEGEVVLTPTPFYAESGGQIGDSGTLEWESGRATAISPASAGRACPTT